MKAYSIILGICLIITTTSIGVGYISAGYWLILPAFLLLGLFWMITKKSSLFWSASGLLLAFYLLAAFGITTNISPILMIIACTVALISWDLMQFNRPLFGKSHMEGSMFLGKYHLRTLVFAASVGLLLALLSLYINLELSFRITTILVLIAIGCLIYSIRYLKNWKL